MHHRRRFRNVAVYAFLALVVGAAIGQQPEQKISKYERDEVLHMLTTISVDPKLHGIDWEANVKTHSQKIETVPSLNRGLSEIAAALDILDDSHTFFLSPRPYIHSYGWRIATIGDKCFVLGVRPQTDPEKKASSGKSVGNWRAQR
jgi:hypothetical protein